MDRVEPNQSGDRYADVADAQAVDAAQTAELATPASVRPDNVPEKFWNAEKGQVNVDALVESNRNLEQRFTQTQQSVADAGGAPEGDTAAITDGGQAAVIQDAQAEWESSQSLSDETYDALDASGISREIVDSYIAGQRAQHDNVYNQAFALAGGSEESFQEMQQWALENLPQAEIDAFNNNVTTDNWKYAIENMYEKYQENAPRETPLISGQGNSNLGGTSPFRSSREMQDAMNSQQYRTDPDYRVEVIKRIQASEAAGISLFQ